jgi:putative PIN family toxin of toxin-antitoxin system
MKMTVVIDCNILVMCITSRSPYHVIYQSLVENKFNLAVSTEIALEYEEVIQEKYGIATANAFMALLKELPNIFYCISYYNWQLIKTDPDDNKYSDCAISGSASYLVTEYKDFSVLKKISFPYIHAIGIDEFVDLLKKG